MNTALEITGAVMCAVAGSALLVIAMRLRKSRPRRCRCWYCRTESPLEPWKRRVWTLALPGPGRAARVRHGLGRAEYAERVRFGMAMNHPEWITGELPDEDEEALAELDEITWEGK